jgi:hypothetical protein
MDTLEKNNQLPDILKSSYLSQKQAQDKLDKYGYEIDPSLSSNQQKVFVNKITGEPLVVHRGTKTLKDVIDDGLIGLGLGKFGFRQKNAMRVNKKIREKYMQDAINVGHSLGGNLAENSGTKNKVITYNKAVGLGDIGKKFNNQTDIRAKGDIISLPSILQSGSKRVLVDNKNKSNNLFKNALNAHKTDNLY